MATTKPKYHRKGIHSEVSPRVRYLLNEVLDLGTSDIYTDAPEYRSRVEALQRLYGLLGEVLRGYRVTDLYGKVLTIKQATDETFFGLEPSEDLKQSNSN